MQGSVNGARLLPDIFHDVDFAALRPAIVSDIVAEHPEGRPHSLPRGNLDSRFEAAIGLAEKPLGFQTRGGVIPRYAIGAGVGFFLCGDHEIAALDLRVLCAIGVILEFVVAPAVTADVVGPFR